jgi:hypothetical protein
VDDIAWVWLSDLEAVGMQDVVLVVRVPDSHRGYVSERYGELFAEAASALAGQPVSVLVVDSRWRAMADVGYLPDGDS